MIQHIVWWTLKEEAEGSNAEGNAKRMVDMLRALEGQIPSLLSLSVSMEIAGSSTEPCDVILVSTHENVEGLQAYAEHPAHMACVDFIRSVVSSRHAIDCIL